ncbi:MAG: phenylalanine--tRNA ligase subunit alpha [Elusimicrobia bacterium]|nr:phenylalanine--tRNA ligase subunit alpha [Elusimicrobiota bacterium]MBI4218164.1 phenylalanine--tRNA ligase subunit alpha [Elusimicrobiota bacterium]
MTAHLNEIEKNFISELSPIASLQDLEELRKRYFGRKGIFNDLLDKLKKLSSEQKQKEGQALNAVKESLEKSLQSKLKQLEETQLRAELEKNREDWSLPAAPLLIGSSHPLTQILEEVMETFVSMGFSVAEGPEIETDENNFGALNIPPDHPARDMHDTFYIRGNPQHLMRTHTSPVQIRVMRSQKPPVRIIAPGRVYRHEAVDATHSSVFHQVEGLAVDENVSFADLKGTIALACQRLFGKNVQTRFRPSYFPFVEPGAEVDISCTICRQSQSNCPVCKGTGWIEMMGAGMVHPNVFQAVGYPPEITGFAFGMGIERIAMIRYGISDMRLFYENHLDFLSQF